MNKVLIALQGPLNNETLNCAKTFLFMKFDLIMICWQDKYSYQINYEPLQVDFIDDPKSMPTKDGVRSINTMRQIVSNRYLLKKYGQDYQYIIKLRNDLKIINRNLFLKQVYRSIKKNKIWTININTTSPRLFTPALLPYHVSDWMFGGTPNQLKKYLQLNDIEEKNLVVRKPREFNNLIFWRNAQNEQVIWSLLWSKNRSNNMPKLLINKPFEESSLLRSIKYASYLNQKFFITAFRESGLQSIKYKCNLRNWYSNTYNLFILNKTECFLINNGFIKLLLLYPPIFRFIVYKFRFFISKRPLRF
tara:strand:+ start:629 stop:1543 length:915 start_codon:yes stop_codon:yes gene_type:complete